jgi:sulfur-oxidizing protein SoxY
MQLNQLTRLYVPAHFVKSVRIWQGQDLLLAIENGISMSENQTFRFDCIPGRTRRSEQRAAQCQMMRMTGGGEFWYQT